MLHAAEYKRRQSAPGVKIGAMSFGGDRRYPISSGWNLMQHQAVAKRLAESR